MDKRSPVLAFLALPLLVSCSVFPGWGEPEVDHVTLTEPASVLENPANVSSVGWTWSSPEETSIRHVSPMSYGLSVYVSDGVIGVNGETGEELWRYRRLGEKATSMNVTPDGETVAVSYSAHEEEPEGEEEPPPVHEVVLLDASTGDVKGSQVVEFARMPFDGSGSSSYTPGNEKLGVLSNDSRIIYRDHEPGGGEVVSLGLGNDEELWSASPGQSGGDEERYFVARSSMVSRGVLIVSSSFVDESVLEPGGLSGVKDHTLALIGIDIETGSELWRHELEVNAAIDLTPFDVAVEPESGVVAAAAIGSSYYEEWLLDPVTGETLTDTDFFTGRDDTAFGILEEAVVSVRSTSEGGGSGSLEELEEREYEHEYSYSDLSGEVQHSVTVPASEPLDRSYGSFTVALEESIAWLDVNERNTDKLSWNPAQLVVTDWDSGESRVIDLGVEVQRRPDNDGSRGVVPALAPPPESMLLAPGALVITEDLDGEENESPRRLVGLVP
ncbi:hypothetical protein [Nocardiopsis synnemataformans]|uniref:hypothetical protein n=1 Tax=Nocardiopsis synnemataformans TaxID=61305 RepID=UPI003EBF7CB1